jgi:hypothetical protein
MQQTLELKFLDEYAPETLRSAIISDTCLTTDQLLMVFEDFLRGCGYVINGSLQVIKDDECC